MAVVIFTLSFLIWLLSLASRPFALAATMWLRS